MKKIIIVALFAVLIFNSCKEQKEVNPKEYLPEAKYDGMKGEIDSIVVIHYKNVEGNKSDIILLKASAIYDKNGYVIENRNQTFDNEGKPLEYAELSITRDSNSLPTGYSILQGNDAATSFKLDKRENKKETYVLACDNKDLANKNLVSKEFTEFTVCTISNFGNSVSSYTETYNEEGKRVKAVKAAKDGKILESSTIEYNKEGQLSKKLVEKDSELEEIFYTDYKLEESPTQNWINRLQKDASGNIKAHEERKIYYRK